MKKLFPSQWLGSVYEIDIEELRKNGVKALIFDLDNTLARVGTPLPDERITAWFRQISKLGIKTCILSNNNHKRVAKFCESLGVPFIPRGLKPLKTGFRRAISLLEVDPSEVCVVGDQIFTDVWGANRSGLRAILVDRINPREGIMAKIKRLPERMVLKKYERNNGKTSAHR